MSNDKEEARPDEWRTSAKEVLAEFLGGDGPLKFLDAKHVELRGVFAVSHLRLIAALMEAMGEEGSGFGGEVLDGADDQRACLGRSSSLLDAIILTSRDVISSDGDFVSFDEIGSRLDGDFSKGDLALMSAVMCCEEERASIGVSQRQRFMEAQRLENQRISSLSANSPERVAIPCPNCP